MGQNFQGSLEHSTEVRNQKCDDKKTQCSSGKGVLPHSENTLRMPAEHSNKPGALDIKFLRTKRQFHLHPKFNLPSLCQ